MFDLNVSQVNEKCWLATYIRKIRFLICSLCFLLLSVLEMDIYMLLAGNVSVLRLRHCDQVQLQIKMSPDGFAAADVLVKSD